MVAKEAKLSPILDESLHTMNGIRMRALFFTVILRLCRAFFLSCALLALWASLRPGAVLEGLVIGTIAFILVFTFHVKSQFRKVNSESFLVSLDMKYSQTKTSPYDLREEAPALVTIDEWKPHLEREIKDTKNFENKRILGLLSSLPLPFFCFVFASLAQPTALSKVLDKVSHVVNRLSDGAELKIVSGTPGDQNGKAFVLTSGKVHQIELLTQNMVEVRVVDRPGILPQIDLRKSPLSKESSQSQTEVFQSFRLVPIAGESSEDKAIYSIAFSVKDDIDIYLSTVSKDEPVAKIDVRQLPIPRISLNLIGQKISPWPDDNPLPLLINTSAENPLRQIRLQIKAEGRTSTEVVSNILATDKKSLRIDYDLLLETYIQSDLSQVEIIAEAVDRSIPMPLVGRSEPLVIETASAYGRYQKTLQTLRELKGSIDESAQNSNGKLNEEAKNLAQTALNQSQDSPFFDGLDRVQMSSFYSKVEGIVQTEDLASLLDLQELLNRFLFEHETLDDKERDRDFFVAARSLSRLIEQDKDKRTIASEVVTERLKSYLDDRYSRWQKRVAYLEKQPQSWPKIQERPFSKAMDAIQEQDQKSSPESQKAVLSLLSKTVSDYRSWLDELENLEDQARRKQEEQRQEGLASAREQLKELQDRQGKVSKRLDKAASRSEAELSENWPSTRMMQNTNMTETKSLEAKLRALSPQAGERIKAAGQAMAMTVDSGGQKSFTQAESASDLAGRLLRQAQSAAQKSQQQGNKRQRRRRVTGDNYYGKRIVGGDIEIKREYSVDKRYREEILDDVSQSKQKVKSEEEARVLEDYLRKVVR